MSRAPHASRRAAAQASSNPSIEAPAFSGAPTGASGGASSTSTGGAGSTVMPTMPTRAALGEVVGAGGAHREIDRVVHRALRLPRVKEAVFATTVWQGLTARRSAPRRLQ